MLNRQAVFTSVEEAIADASRESGLFAVVVIGISGLREVSLRSGYENGEMAEESAHALVAQSLRPVDRVFRIAEERFVIVLPGMRNSNHVLLAITRLLSAFERPITVTSTPWQIHPVMGVALYPEHGLEPDLLCRRAEMALDEAQRRGEQFAYYQPQGTQVEIFYEEFHSAIEANRLKVHLQPIMDLRDKRIVGVESLSRWTSLQRGEVSPADFIPYAEHNGLISSLTRWSINATLRHAATLPQGSGLAIAINVSPRTFIDPGFVEQFMDALKIWGVPPTSIIAEITETALVNDLDLSVAVLRRMRDRGMRIAIDDFGTGYASISYLRKFPATELKIDKSLIIDLHEDNQSARLVSAIIKLAHDMNLATVAEGIENQPTLDLLAGFGCDLGQGYHIGRPIPAQEFIAGFSDSRDTRNSRSPGSE